MPDLAGLTTNFFPTPNEGFITTTSGSIDSSSATTIGLNSVSGLTNGSVFTGLIDPGNAKQRAFTGVVDTGGSQITSVVFTTGSSATHTAGATVVDYVTSTHVSQISKGVTQEHKQSGAHKDITADSVTVATGKITTSAVGKLEDAGIPLTTYRTETMFDHVASGCVWSGDAYGSTRNASMTSGVVYIGGQRVTVSAVTARSFTASKDTYIDVNNSGTITYTEVANNAASPALSANNIRLGIIVTGASNIANVGSVNQGEESKVLPIASSVPYAVTDSLGNLICPRDPNRKILGYRQIITNFTTTSGTAVQVTGLSCPVVIPTGRKIKISGFGTLMNNSALNSASYFSIWDGVVGSGTMVTYEQNIIGGASGSGVSGASPSAIITPSSTTKTYNVGLTSSGGNTATMTALSSAPAYILVELV